MPDIRRLVLVLLSGSVIAAGIAPPAAGGQRSGTLAVSVEVVATCTAATDSGGAASAGCVSEPVAVRQEAAAVPTVDGKASAPVARTVEQAGTITVIY